MSAEDIDLVVRVERQIAADVGMTLPDWHRWVDEVGHVLPRYGTPDRDGRPAVRCDYCGNFLPAGDAVLQWVEEGGTGDGRTLVRVAAYHPARCTEAGR